MKAEMEKIDNAIKTLTELSWEKAPATPNSGSENNSNNTNNTDNTDNTNANNGGDTTTTPAPAEEKQGCGSALNSTYAVIALVAVLGFAFIAKKKEEN